MSLTMKRGPSVWEEHEETYQFTNRKYSGRCACILDKWVGQCQPRSYRKIYPLSQRYRIRKIYEGWVNVPEGLR